MCVYIYIYLLIKNDKRICSDLYINKELEMEKEDFAIHFKNHIFIITWESWSSRYDHRASLSPSPAYITSAPGHTLSASVAREKWQNYQILVSTSLGLSQHRMAEVATNIDLIENEPNTQNESFISGVKCYPTAETRWETGTGDSLISWILCEAQA